MLQDDQGSIQAIAKTRPVKTDFWLRADWSSFHRLISREPMFYDLRALCSKSVFCRIYKHTRERWPK